MRSVESCFRPRPPSVQNNAPLHPPDAGRGDVGIDIGLQQMMAGHDVMLAALFMQSHPWRRLCVNTSLTFMQCAPPKRAASALTVYGVSKPVGWDIGADLGYSLAATHGGYRAEQRAG